MSGVPLREAQDAWLYGGKAVQLGAALRAGLPGPDGFGLDRTSSEPWPGAKAELWPLSMRFTHAATSIRWP